MGLAVGGGQAKGFSIFEWGLGEEGGWICDDLGPRFEDSKKLTRRDLRSLGDKCASRFGGMWKQAEPAVFSFVRAHVERCKCFHLQPFRVKISGGKCTIKIEGEYLCALHIK